jgi:hypothetical protein
MATQTQSIIDAVLDDLADRIAARLNGVAPVAEATAPRSASNRAESLAKARAAKAEKAAAAKTTAPAKKAGAAKKAAPKAAAAPDVYTREQLEELDREGVLAVAEEVGYELGTPKERTNTVIEGILSLFEPEAEEAEEEEEAEEAEEAEAEEGGEYWTREELEDKGLGELRKVAAEFDLDTKGLGKAEVIDLILSDEE